MTALSTRALLVTLGISQWTARKLDRSETNKVNRDHGLTIEAVRVNKKLLPLGMALERVHQTTGMIRKDFAQRTLPWGIDGVNILKSSEYMAFTGVVNGWHNAWSEAVGAFIEGYPDAITEAKALLGSMFNADDYPDPAEIAKRFAFNVRFMPVPDKDDWRIDVGTEGAEVLKAAITAQVQEAEAHAMREAYSRVFTLVERAAERLTNPEHKFKDSLVENAKELCALLPSLNLTNDPKLEALRQKIERSLCAQTPQVLRDDLSVREGVAATMNDIMRKMGGVYGSA